MIGYGAGGLSIVAWWVLLGLKLSGAITWSWWIVTAPLWVVGAQLVVSVIILAVVGSGLIKGMRDAFGGW
jgi:hypothetical protein